jgi:hypothetical protein
MHGVLKDCFELSGGTKVVALLRIDEGKGTARVGDWVVFNRHAWRISGIEMPNYFGRTAPTDPEILNAVGVILEGASKADLTPLIGQPFDTERSRTT